MIGAVSRPRSSKPSPRGLQVVSPPGCRPLAGFGEEGVQEEDMEAILEPRGDGPRDLVGRAIALDPFALAPALEVGIALRRVLPHGEGIDQVLELLRELAASRLVTVGGLDHRRDLPPVNDAVAGHGRGGPFYRKDAR